MTHLSGVAPGSPGAPVDAWVGEMREERRIVTAVFADIVGSTALTERLDLEDARDILGGAIRLVIAQVDALGGTVKDLAGDGVLALFGAPVAHEDDAERAILCGLGITNAIADYGAELAGRWGLEGFSVRVGIETGRAVLGQLGGGSRVEYGATGDVLNTAARLQSQADPGQVLVGTATRAMVESRFVWDAPQTFAAKGKHLPVVASVVRAYSPHRHLPPVFDEVPLVARSTEMQVIGSAIERLRDGDGSVVAFIGDAGVGKSRLVEEARRVFARGVSARWLETGGSSFATSVPYLLYRNLVLSWLGVPLNAGRESVLRVVEERAATLPAGQAEPLRNLMSVLSGAAVEGTGAEAVQERVFSSMQALLRALASEQPLAVVLEDLQWSDPTSLLLTERVVGLAVECPLLLMVTVRPEPAALASLERIGEVGGDRMVCVSLAPMTRDDDRKLLRALLGGADLPRSLEERLLDTTDGNPFFVEEQARALATTGALERAQGRLHFVGAPDLQLEPTVERALIARIDRLGEQEHQTLLAASVLGSSFDARLVSVLTGFDASAELDELKRADFVCSADAEDGSDTFRFRHALVQEASYGSLLRRQRRSLHARAAAALEARYQGRQDEIAATLGHHLAEGGDPERAIGYLRTAAQDAAATFANEEAATLAREALALIDRSSPELADSDRRAATQLLGIQAAAERALARYDAAVHAFRGQLALIEAENHLGRARIRALIGQTLMDAHRYDEALAELDRAEAAVAGPPEGEEAFAAWLDVMLARGSVHYWLADHEQYSDLLARVEPIVAARANRQQRIAYYGSVRAALWRRDKYVISDDLARFDGELFEAEHDTPDEEARAWALFQHGFTLMWHRDLAEAQPLLRESLAAAEHLGSTLLRARALTYLMLTARLRGDASESADLVEPVHEAAVEAELPEYDAMAAATRAWLASRSGDEAAVKREAVRALDLWSSLPNRYPVDWLACFPLLGVAAKRRDLPDAQRWVQMMLSEQQQRLPDSIAQPLRDGLAAADRGDAATAIAHFDDALVSARVQGYL